MKLSTRVCTVTLAFAVSCHSGGVAHQDPARRTMDRERATQPETASASPSARPRPAELVGDVATQVAFISQPSNSAAGTAIAPAVTVAVEDASGNVVTTSSASVSVRLTNASGASLSGTKTATAVHGVATFSDLNVQRAGSGYQLLAASGSLTSATSDAFSVLAGSASQLAFTTQPSNVAAGMAMTPSVTVTVEDQFANPVPTSSASVTVGLATNPTGATLFGTLTQTAVGGLATFSDLNLQTVATGYTLSAASPSLTTAISGTFSVTAGAAAQLAFLIQPSNTAAGTNMTPAVTVGVEDVYGNVVTRSTAAVTLNLAVNPSHGELYGTLVESAVKGVATFTTLHLHKVGTGYALGATSGTLSSATSQTFGVSPGSESQLLFTTEPSSVAAGAALSPAVTVTAEDAYGNPVTGSTAPVTVTFGTNPSGATLFGTLTQAVLSGVATFGDLSVDVVGKGYTLSASDGTFSATSDAFPVTPGPARQLAFLGQPSNLTAGTPMTPAVTVAVEDAYGNVCTRSAAAVTVSLATNPTNARLVGAVTGNAVSGVATFGGLGLHKAGSGYALGAASVGLSGATSQTFGVAASTPVQLFYTVQPSNIVAGGVMTPGVAVALEDVYDNPVSGAAVSIAIDENPGGAPLLGTLSQTTLNGVATFTDLSIQRAGVGYTLAATWGGIEAPSNSFTVTAGSVAQLAFLTPPSDAIAGVAMAPAVTVGVEDPYGNIVLRSTALVTLNLAASPANASLYGTASETAVKGVATFPDVILKKAGTGYAFGATSGSLSSPPSQTFSITAAAGSQLLFTTQPSNAAAGTAVAPAVTVTVEDAYANVATSSATATMGLVTNPAGATLFGTLTQPFVNGVATFPDLTLETVGSGYQLGATSGLLTTLPSSAFSITAGQAESLVFTTQPSNAGPGVALQPSVTVAVEDAYGNLQTAWPTDVTLSLVLNPASAALDGTLSQPAVNGVATFTDLSIATTGIGYELGAGSGLLTSLASNPFNIQALAPQLAGATLTYTGAEPTVLSTLTCTPVGAVAPDGETLTLTYAWEAGGATIPGATGPTLATGFSKEETVYCTVTVSDDGGSVSMTSAGVAVQDSPPTVASASITSSQDDVCGSWTCNGSGVYDADGDMVILRYRWYVNGVQLANAKKQTLTSGDLGAGDAGDVVMCTVQGNDGDELGPVTDSEEETAQEYPPVIAWQAGPATSHPGASLSCGFSTTDSCSLSVTDSYAWQVNGTTVAGANLQSFSTAGLNPGDVVQCVGTAADTYRSSTEPSPTVTTLVNHPPVISEVQASSEVLRPISTSTIECIVTASDPDNDTLTTTYSWQVNGVTVPGATSSTLAGVFSVGQSVACSATVSDPWTSVSANSFDTVSILPQYPTVASAVVVGTSACGELTCDASGVVDPDGLSVTLTYDWLSNGGDQGINLQTLPPNTLEPSESVQCRVSAVVTVNGVQTVGPYAQSAAVTLTGSPPLVTAQVTPASARIGDTLTCAASSSDVCDYPDNITISWQVNGTTVSSQTFDDVASASSTFSTSSVAAGQSVTCVAKGADVWASATVDSGSVPVAPTTWTITGDIASGWAGYAVAVIDDLNGDGYREIAIGAPNTSGTGVDRAGAVYIVDGTGSVSSSPLSTVVAGTNGVFQAGEHGSFNNSVMVCNQYTDYVGGCPTVDDTVDESNNITADTVGPDGAGVGWAMAYAGDLDGDGIGDLVVTAPYDQVGDLWTGQTYVLSGRSLRGRPYDDATSGAAGFLFQGECGRRRGLDLKTISGGGGDADLSGWRVAPLGDVNGDGLADFAVSAPNNGDYDEGTIYAVFGRTDGETVVASDIFERGCNLQDMETPGPSAATAGFAAYFPRQAQSASAPPRWGRRIGAAGDFNGDGYDDFLVAPHGGESISGYAWLMLGGATPSAQQITTLNPATEWEVQFPDFNCNEHGCTGFNAVGWPSGGGGDVNGDGYDDLAFDARDFTNNGIMNVLYGRPEADGIVSLNDTIDGSGRGFEVTGLPGNIGINLDSESGAISIVGDINGDGYDDVVLGVPTQGSNYQGAVFVVYGSAEPPSGLSWTQLREGIGGFTIEPTTSGLQMGASIAGGDVDGDGLTDIVIGEPGASGTDGEGGAGVVMVLYGRDFTGSITFMGGPGNDTYTGTSAAESIVGGQGDDVLVGGGGADVIYGGSGNDTIEVDDDTFRRVDGGLGTDTLVLGSGVTELNLLGQQRRRIQNIERIQMQGQTVNVSKLGAIALSNTNHTLALFGTGTVNVAADDHWVSTGTVLGADGNTYVTVADGQAQLWIATSLTLVIPPTIFNGTLNIPEHSAVGTIVATLTGADPAGNTATLQWTLDSDGSGAFALDSQGDLTVTNAAPLNYWVFQWPWNLTVSVTDQAGLQTTATFVIDLTPVPDPPVFQTSAPVWSVPENAQGQLGTVTATDPDPADAISYSLVNDTTGLFQVDASGNVSLQSGAGFNATVQSLYTVTVQATDTTNNLTAQVAISIEVVPLNPLTTSAQVSFELRNWSIYQDTTSSSFSGFDFPEFTDQQLTSTCLSPAKGDETFEQSVGEHLSNAVTGYLPVEFDAQYGGSICTSGDVKYDSGTFNATVPYDITFSYPETIIPGQSFTLTSTATPSYTGGSLWGTTSGFELTFGVQLQDFTSVLGVCNKLTDSCTTLVDIQSANGSYNQTFGLPVESWTASALGTSSPYGFALTSPVSATTQGLAPNFTSFINDATVAMGLPPNTGTFSFDEAGNDMQFTYTALNLQAGLQATGSWTFQLDVTGVTATMTFEDNSFTTFALGGSTTIPVPADADANHDGRVEVTISLALNSTFQSTWDHTTTGGYWYSGGYGDFQVLDIYGDTLAQDKVGPMLAASCDPDIEEDDVTLHCISSSDSQQFSFSPSGFSTPVIQGGFNVAQ